MSMSISLEGKAAVITGGSRGIGKAAAMELARCGADIAVIYSGNEQAAQDTVSAIKDIGANAECYLCDVRDFDACKETSALIAQDFPNVAILVNNAGITRDSLLMSMSEDAFAQVIDVNLRGAFNMMKHFSRMFIRARYGRIINISSVVALTGNAGQANYCASKAGLIGLTRSTAAELAPRGITCNAIAPGFIDTDMTSALPPAVKERLLSAIPVGRAGQPEEVAALICFLASDRASYINGEVIRIDGGMKA